MKKSGVRMQTATTGVGAAIAAALILMAGAPPSSHPLHAAPSHNLETWHDAVADPGKRIMVSLEQKRLWLVVGGDTVMSAPIAIGTGRVFRFANRTYHFRTPTGERRILAKDYDANWIPPDWHYFEKAVNRGLEPVHLKDGDLIELSDGTSIEVRDKEVGRINQWGNWWPFTPGSEIMFDGKIFIPPFGSPQRVIPHALGPVKLMLGDGYLIHGTHRFNEGSIGSAASHGCIRMNNADVERLARLVDVGTPVYIY
jgi:hypothetical protein